MKSMTKATVVLLAGLAVGCHSYKPVTATEAQSEIVRIQFARATDVNLTGDGDSSRVVAVRELTGAVLSVQNDSIRLVVSEGEDGSGRAVSKGSIAMIPSSAAPELERRRISTSRSIGAVFGGVAAIAAVFVLMVQLDKK